MKIPGIETAIPAVVSGTLTTVDRQKISFQHFKNGHQAVIIIAHGYYNSKQCVILQQLAYALRGQYDIFMFDFRGHGKSSGLFTWTSREGNDLKAVLDFISPLYHKKGLISFSVGASTSINVLANDKRVDSFICVSAPSDMARIDYWLWASDWKKDTAYTFLDAQGRIGKGVRPGPFWLTKQRPIDNIGKIIIPIMFIHGSRDWVIRPWHSKALYQKAGGLKKIVFIENGPHAEYLMRDYPGQFVSEVKSFFFDTLIKKDDLVIHKIFAQISSRFPDRVCLQIKNGPTWEKWTYGQIEDLSLRIGAYLIKEGFKKGNFACLCMENRPEWAAIYLGIMVAGLACVPLDPQLAKEEIENLVNDCSAKIIFVSKSIFQEKDFQGIKARLSKIVILDLDIEKDNLIGLGQVKSTLREGAEWPEAFSEDIASLIYTSGTTGSPKGVMLTHKNLYSNFQSIDKLGLFSDKDTFISILPLHHAYPFMITLLTPLFCRARVTYTSSLRSDELLSLMREARVTVLVGVPQLFSLFFTNISEKIKKMPVIFRMFFLGLIEIMWKIRKFSGINLSKPALSKIHYAFGRNLRFFACGGAKLNEEAERFLMKIGFTILEGYGLTETSPVVAFNPLKRQKIGSVGRVVPDVEVKIDNPGDSGVGEVVIRGPNVMKGYYNKAKETADVLRDGWFYSGDLGYIDKDGYLYITGRKKEIIVLSSGKNIYPEEIEAHYAKSPYIKEICVLGAGQAEEERLTAVVVPDADYCRKAGEVDLNSVIRWELENLSDGLATYKRIKGYIIVREDMPRTRLGKIKRHEVKNKYLDELKGIKSEGAAEGIPATEDDLRLLTCAAGRKIIEALNKYVKPERQIYPCDHIELDLGIDSLGRVELIIALEQALNIRIPNELMAKVFTVKELIFEIERLVPVEEAQREPVLQGKSQTVWNDILNEKPAKDIIKKVNLSPNRMTILGMLLFAEILHLVFRVIWSLKVSGRENIPGTGKCIFCVNHGSYLDAFIVDAAMPAGLRKGVFFVGFKAYFEQPFIRSIRKYIRVIPIDPGMHFVEAMQASAYVLKNDRMVCIFPEGQRTIDGDIKEFKKGVGILARELNIPLVPVLITGSYESWPRTKPLPRPHPIKITFGRPFSFDELKVAGLKFGARDEYEAIAFGIRQEVIKLR
ncbi:MAG: alpha/beta fold hydrolase [Candidatus Omnitrophota bacterium]|jgi:long-chain acyl-CoA synthetase